MNEFRIDSHKLMYHLDRLKRWLDGEDIYPIYMEISPSGACNQRCTFCAFDYLKYKTQFIDTKKLLAFLSEAARLGVKSIMYGGEGEPLLHKDIAEIINYTKKVGIDTALTTNGTLLDKDFFERCLDSLTWVRVSLNAGTSKNYSRIHRCRPEDFKRVLNNITEAVKIKRRNNYSCTIGVQFLLLPDNYHETTILAKKLKEREVDYLIIKPYSHHPMSENEMDRPFSYSDYLHLDSELHKLADDNFKVVFRINTIRKLEEKRPYKYCLGLPFWAYIDSAGNIYACSAFLGDQRLIYGNINRSSFEKIWNSDKRKKIMKIMESDWNIDDCREICRLDEINRYLWELKHPPLHVNFI